MIPFTSQFILALVVGLASPALEDAREADQPPPRLRRSAVVSAKAEAPPPQEALPEVSAFTAKVRARLRTDRALQAQYTFLERREEVTVSKLGKVKDGPVKVYEVYPSEDVGNTYKRLISVDGKPLSKEELDRNDRIHQQHLLERLNESSEAKARRARQAARDQEEDQRLIDDVFAVYKMTLVRRDVIDGHPAILISLEPQPRAKTRTDEGKMMKKVRARAWIHETEYQVVRVEIEMLGDIGMGFGIVGKIYKGTVGEFVRTKVNGEVWLPQRARLTAKGRALFRRFAIDSVTEWWDYKKFRVETTEQPQAQY